MSQGIALSRLLRAVIRRQRIAEATALLARIALPCGLVIAALAILAARRLGTPISLAWLATLPLPLVLGYALLRPRSPRIAARRADHCYALADRLGNAFELAAQKPPDDPQSAAIAGLIIAEAEQLAGSLDARPVVSLRPPALRWIDLAAFLLLAVALLIPPPESSQQTSKKSPTAATEASPKLRPPPPERHLLEPLRQDLKTLGKRDDAAAKLAQAMLQVLDAFARGELDREAAFAQLSALDAQLLAAEADLEASLEEDPGILAEGIRELSLALEAEPITEDAGQHFARGEGDEGSQALDKAGEQAEADAAKSEALDRALKAAEKALGKAVADARDSASELAEAERRLRRQQKQKDKRGDDNSEEDERRLQKQKKRVEELRRQHEREKAAQRSLEQLRRDAREARQRSQGQQGKGGQKGQKGAQGGGQRSQAQRRALERLSRGAAGASKKSQGARRLGQARDNLEDAKTFIRRSGKKGSQGDTRKQQMERFGRAAKGKGKDKAKGKGKGKKGPTLLIEGDVGEGEPDMLLEGDGQDSSGEGEGQEGDGQGQGEGQGGQEGAAANADGIGNSTQDPLGEASQMKVRARNVKVDPRHGRGATRAEVISTASQDGFASESYRDVFTDYHGFAQSALDGDEVPIGQRRQIKRYFRLIQPRR